ncbi:hypothetical protein JVX91_16665 [Pseudomonas sp. PDNC002]|uniref:hypothetical protein n=1 Tax=Pseudomonas sp. PDNC002 TaxID=2811422 RepID=UPI001965554E|nr:hypothetical protein [Pseudomonas sp. PDNC002]QRY77242.1 hypothetical protein JVX91_16665 [Pseudomonas sp. PDNC002]
MSETAITLRVQFRDEARAQHVLGSLAEAAGNHGHELSASLAALAPVGSHGPEQTIDIEHMERQDTALVIRAYAGRIETPLWLIPGLVELGATRTVLSESRDDGGMHYHFIGAKKVSKKAFEASAALMPKPPLQASPDLFLPEGRVVVKATLISHEWKESMFERFCVMRMQAEDGRHFLYKGSAGLTDMTADDHVKTCTFSATFELGEYDGKTVAFARRPTRIQLGEISPAKVKSVRFSGRNKAFMDDVFGPLITHYLQDLSGKPDALIQRMGAGSLLEMDLTALFALLKQARAYSFDGFGHYVSVSGEGREVFEIYTVGDVAVDLDAARRHLDALDVTATYKDDSPATYTLYWLHAGIRVRFKVWAKGFECFLDRQQAALD